MYHSIIGQLVCTLVSLKHASLAREIEQTRKSLLQQQHIHSQHLQPALTQSTQQLNTLRYSFSDTNVHS
jgi:cell division protein ZapA (FtsZ GTPase activity inhibitor)